MRGGEVVGIGRDAIAGQFCVDAGTAGLGVLKFLDHDDTGPFAHDKTITIDIKGTRGALRLVVAHRKGLHVAESGEAHRTDRRLGATRDEGVGVAEFDHAPSFPDVVIRGRAGGNDAHVRTTEVEFHRDHPARDVRDHHRDGERRNARGGFLEQVAMLGLQRDESSDAAADHAAEAVEIHLIKIDPRIPHRHDGSGHAELGERVGAARVLRVREKGSRIKPADDPSDLAIVAGETRIVDARNPARSGDEAAPRALQIVSNRGDDSHSGDDDASFHFSSICEGVTAKLSVLQSQCKTISPRPKEARDA